MAKERAVTPWCKSEQVRLLPVPPFIRTRAKDLHFKLGMVIALARFMPNKKLCQVGRLHLTLKVGTPLDKN